MERSDFDHLVEQAWRRIPRDFRRRVENVAIVIEDEPSQNALQKAGVPRGSTLLGLYQGVPLPQRSTFHQVVMPDKITLYQGPIERAARNDEDIARVVYDTLWHEVAHYFGLNERQVRAAEGRPKWYDPPRKVKG
jgi:predicted Zn-dependent protease with MMP-like domain